MTEAYLDIFGRAVAAWPDVVAVSDGSGSLTYAELDALSSGRAEALRAGGVVPGSIVGVRLPRVKEICVEALAVLKAGGAYMPIDCAYPEDRVKYMLEDSGGIHPDAALVLYTSGTTGRPKGVVHTQDSLLAICRNAQHLFALGPGSQVAVTAGFTFIASVVCIFPALLAGATVHIVDEDTREDMNLLYKYILDRRISHIFLPAGLGATMVEEYDFSAVKVFCAGEKLRPFTPKAKGCVYNMYGSTEGVIVLAAQVSGSESEMPLGTPMPDMEVRIVDDSLQPVADGEVGEMVYTGPIMASRYLNLPEQTAGKWYVRDGVRWFRTGDRARLDGDGRFYYLGRMDNMVKIRGFRVETGEVEAQILQEMAGAARAVVVALKNVHGTDHLCCYYEADAELDTEAVSEAVSHRLAEYMVPSVWMRMASLPRNANGKVMRQQLPEPRMQYSALSAMYSEVELRVVETVRRVLALDCFAGIDENFLELGGNSIKAMKLAAELCAQGIHTDGPSVLRLKVLRSIAAEAKVDYERLWTGDEYSAVLRDFAARGEKVEMVLPISSEQDDMLFRQILHPDSCSMRDVYVLEIDTRIEAGVMRGILDRIGGDFPRTRTAIVYRGVSLFQQVVTDRRIPMDVVDVANPGEALHTLKEVYSSLTSSPFDPETTPMMSVRCVNVSDSKAFVFILCQHICLDRRHMRDIARQLMEGLSAAYPEDASIREWLDLLSFAIGRETAEVSSAGRVSIADRFLDTPIGKGLSQASLTGEAPQICVYSDHPGLKKVFFVHTANTGSDAYYRLADRIGDKCSFAVLEPYNLYHPEDARDGVPALAALYVEIIRKYQPHGPYYLGGWCYGGVVAHEMACQLQAAGEQVERLVMLDSHCTTTDELRRIAEPAKAAAGREYFESCPLFAELRAKGMLEAMIANGARVSRDMFAHTPQCFDGPVLYFKPSQTPIAATGGSLRYWQTMMKYEAGNFEHYCDRSRLTIVFTPHEHDLMMDDESLDIIVPEILKTL